MFGIVVMGHANRHLAIDPKTGGLFVGGVGSSGNIGVEPEVKASIQRFDSDGRQLGRLCVEGLRNRDRTRASRPDTGDLYAVVQERDGLGDNLVPDYMTRVTQGAFYGWPYSYVGHHPHAWLRAAASPDKVKAAVTPDLLFQAHSSAMDVVFYTGSQFSSEYQAVTLSSHLKGSWNRSEPTGYKVVRVPFKDGKPQGFYQNFMTGFTGPRGCIAGSVGPACCARRRQGRRAARCRRHRRHRSGASPTPARPASAAPASPPPTTGSRQLRRPKQRAPDAIRGLSLFLRCELVDRDVGLDRRELLPGLVLARRQFPHLVGRGARGSLAHGLKLLLHLGHA